MGTPPNPLVGQPAPTTAEAARAPQVGATTTIPVSTNATIVIPPGTALAAKAATPISLAQQVNKAQGVTLSREEFSNSSKVVIIFGDSGLGKSTQLYYAAKWAFNKTGKPVRLISVESSSQTIFQSLIDAGIVESFIVPKLKDPFSVFRKLSYGEWPNRSGVFAAGNPQNYSAYIWEGLTSTSECLLEDCREKGRSVGQDVVGKFEENGEKFSKAAPSHYDLVQSEAIRALKTFAALPIGYLFVSAHEAAGKDNDTAKSLIRGAGMVGSAKVDTVKKWCGTLLHLEGYPVTVQLADKDGAGKALTVQRTKTRAWFQPHPDMNNPMVTYPAKTTLPPDKMPKLLEKFPSGFFEPTLSEGTGLDTFMESMTGLLEASTTDLTAWKKEVEARHAGKGK